MSDIGRQIHLLYVPTLACNLGCSYCYLGEQTQISVAGDADRAVDTLRYALSAFSDSGLLPFNVSLHGGEPTILPEAVLEELFVVIERHYLDHYDALQAAGHRKSTPHLKTNLFNFQNLYNLFDRHRVSISGSIDLPLELHGRYRTDRGGYPWLERTKENLRLLAGYPHSKKISATVYREHLGEMQQLVDDIWFIHNEIGFDMNNFNIMFGFETALNSRRLSVEGRSPLHQSDESQQLQLYECLKRNFCGTALEYGFRRNWFDEFMPSYCTNSRNCGERFFLLQSDGSVWSCVRGQGVEQLRYGNIFQDSVSSIMERARIAVAAIHAEYGLDPLCRSCEWLYLCNSGCPAVKRQTASGRSYTCALQKQLYRDNPLCCPPVTDLAEKDRLLREYLLAMHPAAAFLDQHGDGTVDTVGAVVPQELCLPENSLKGLINSDPILAGLYSNSAFQLLINAEPVTLCSQLLAPGRTLHRLSSSDRVELLISPGIFDLYCSEPLRNTLYIQMLRDTTVVYGDERRPKQEHLFTHQIFYRQLATLERQGALYLTVDLGGLLRLHSNCYLKNVLNNMFFTTSYLRDYHYQKQKENGFYHIQAMNLPFQNLEFYWDS